MKNYEKYADEIREYKGVNFCKDFVKPNILKSEDCGGVDCDKCHMLQMLWLLEEYEEPETDWSKVKVDTPILVRDFEGSDWFRRYFAKYENGKVYAWGNGCTSWTKVYAWGNGCTSWTADNMYAWKYAKLAEGEEE